ncbi:glycosyltransferase involved in cell wall biosynthesis [Arcticibacter pallidicorallinus]|uniref:Glycosyltransferase involved in cell wall biosynthesis n=1 Tax=Arcticibacter pallidicorallinus TaxID=1259464 RepID=A0A2T0U6W7_9SPHI|nr:glycosyltransferase family 1 protein [Arcticibacter pallidicorallinus]PRY53663.1 glycosyltransferase involved in cell wall biosynthesis [Arcticibacter pallidicorallinus]
MKKIFYDASLAFKSERGMAKFVRNLVLEIHLRSDSRIVGLVNISSSKSDVRYLFLGKTNPIFWEQVVLPFFLRRTKPEDVMIFPYNTAPIVFPFRAKKILVVHDLIFMESFQNLKRSNSLKQNIGRIYRKFVVPKVIKNADLIITVSNFSRSQIAEKFNIEMDKIVVIPNTVDPIYKRTVGNDPSTGKQYIFNVSGEAPHKNLESLINAYSLLPNEIRSKYDLVILGVTSSESRKFFNMKISDLGLQGKIKLLSKVSDTEAKSLYENASCFVFPSLHEGFGIPLLEAMSCDCAITCSNTSCLPEIAGNAALYFNPYSEADIAQKITKVLSDCRLADSLRLNGRLQLEKYNYHAFSKAVDDLVQML